MGKRKPTDIIQLKIRMTEALRARLEEDAERRGASINSEVVRRLEHSFDRSELLSEVLALTYGRRLAGILMALGLVMNTAAALAGRDPLRRDDWADEYSAYRAAQHAAKMLLELWDPPEIDPLVPQSIASRPATRSLQAVETLVHVLAKWGEAGSKYADVGRVYGIDLLGPLAAGMAAAFPEYKKKWPERWAMQALLESEQGADKVVSVRGKAS